MAASSNGELPLMQAAGRKHAAALATGLVSMLEALPEMQYNLYLLNIIELNYYTEFLNLIIVELDYMYNFIIELLLILVREVLMLRLFVLTAKVRETCDFGWMRWQSRQGLWGHRGHLKWLQTNKMSSVVSATDYKEHGACIFQGEGPRAFRFGIGVKLYQHLSN